MKTSTDNDDKAGSVVQTTTTRRILPAGAVPLGKERTTPEFWPYIEGLQQSDWDNHLLYIYRIEGDRNIPLEKIAGHMAGADGHQVPLSDREELELGIAQKYGGRIFRLILKRGSERVTETRVYIEAPPKQVQPAIFDAGSPTVQSESSATADVAKTAINTMANSERAAVDVAVTALRGAADVVTRLSQPQQPAGLGGDDTMRQIMSILVQRALNPPDPVESLTKLLALLREITPGGAAAPGVGGAPSAVIDRILNTAVDKLLNPAPSGPATSAGAELVRQLPNVAAYVSQALSEWRHGSEAQRDTALVMAGRPIAAGAPAPGAPATRPNPAPRALPPESQTMAGLPSLEFIESKIIEILREPMSTDEAADETLAFLDRMDPALPKQLADLGEPGLLQLFQQRKTLQPALQNLPRLQEFIRAFLKFAAEHAAGDGPGEAGAGGAGSVKPN